MLILAIYYTIADVVLLGQCFYYKGFTWKDDVVQPPPKPPRVTVTEPNERTGLLDEPPYQRQRRDSAASWTHLSPAVPLISEPPPTPPQRPTTLQTCFWNATAILMVSMAGVAGYFLSRHYTEGKSSGPKDDDHFPQFNVLGQVFGWLCAVFYLGSRLPQLLLNWRRKSTEGVSMLFFLFACLGNLTYVLSILMYEPTCANPRHCELGETRRIYGRYILVNLSWLAGSLGTLFLDFGIFTQFFIYNKSDVTSDEEGDEEESSIDEQSWDQRPLP